MKIVKREFFDDGLDLIVLSCDHSMIVRTTPNERLLKAGMPDDTWVSPESTVVKCPVCETL